MELRLLVLPGVILLTGLLGVQNASATTPDRNEESFTASGSIDCSAINPAWKFTDEFVDVFNIERQFFYGPDGDLIRIVEHRTQTSTDVNSVSGLTINEHNSYLVVADLTDWTITINGAIGVAQRRGAGSVIQNTGHKVFELDLSQNPPLGTPLANGGPVRNSPEDFCRAIA
jgi:hypothetical protein